MGTGSLLVACAALGSYCIGSDIDWKVTMGVSSFVVKNLDVVFAL